MDDEDFMTDLVDDAEDPQEDYLEGTNKEVVTQDPDPDKVVKADLEMDPAAATESFVRRKFGLSEDDVIESCESLQEYSQEDRMLSPIVDTFKGNVKNKWKHFKDLFNSDNKLTRNSWWESRFIYTGKKIITDKNDLMNIDDFKTQCEKLKKYMDGEKEKSSDIKFVKQIMGEKANDNNCFSYKGLTIILYIPSSTDAAFNETFIMANAIFNKKDNPKDIKDLEKHTFFGFTTKIPPKSVNKTSSGW